MKRDLFLVLLFPDSHRSSLYHDNWQSQRAINVMADGSYVKLTTVRFTPLFIKAQGLN